MCDEDWLYYNTTTQVYTLAQKITIDRRCNGITVINNGTNNAIFDDETLVPGESKSIAGNRREIFVGRKDLSFPSAPPGNSVVVTQKYYVKLEKNDPHNLDAKGL
jgi:hypothetical protein